MVRPVLLCVSCCAGLVSPAISLLSYAARRRRKRITAPKASRPSVAGSGMISPVPAETNVLIQPPAEVRWLTCVENEMLTGS